MKQSKNNLNTNSALSVDQFNSAIEVSNMNFYYGETQALKNITMKIPEQKVTAFIGPSGCGKSTLLRVFNRMNDLIENT